MPVKVHVWDSTQTDTAVEARITPLQRVPISLMLEPLRMPVQMHTVTRTMIRSPHLHAVETAVKPDMTSHSAKHNEDMYSLCLVVIFSVYIPRDF